MGISSTDWDAVTALATAITALGVPVSAGFIWVQLRQAKEASLGQVEQLRQAREVSQTQVYQTLLDRAERVHLNQALDAVRSLTCTSYEDYSVLPEETKNQVRVAVEFFNEIRHLLPPDSNMIELEYVRSLWGMSILSCADKLWTRQAWLDKLPVSWWLVGLRNEKADAFQNEDMSGYFYRGFERLCWTFKRLEDPGGCRDNWEIPDERWYW
jgi:hypothetical protein